MKVVEKFAPVTFVLFCKVEMAPPGDETVIGKKVVSDED